MSDKKPQFVVGEPLRTKGTDRVDPTWSPGDEPTLITVPEGFDAVAQFERWVTPKARAGLSRIKGDEFARAEHLIRHGSPEEAYVAWVLLRGWLVMWGQAQS